MNKYIIEITETLQRMIEVEAKDEKSAILDVAERYKKGEIVLDSSDFIEYEIKGFCTQKDD